MHLESRTWVAACATLCLAPLIGRATEVVERVSISTEGKAANDWSGHPAISADGQIVAFSSRAANLVAGDTNGDAKDDIGQRRSMSDVFVRDRTTCTTTRVSTGTDGTEADGTSRNAALSADGRVVVFESNSSNLGPVGNRGGGEFWWNTYLHDRTTGVTKLVSQSTDGVGADGDSLGASISADGEIVLFLSGATNLLPTVSSGIGTAYLYDRATGRVSRAIVGEGGEELNAPILDAVISGDGNHVLFSSAATNLPGITPTGSDVSHVYVLDRPSGVLTRLSGADGGWPPLAISGDGCDVLFRDASIYDLLHADCRGTEAISLGTTLLASLSADGKTAAVAGPGDLIPGQQTGSAAGVFVLDTTSATGERVSATEAGELAVAWYQDRPAISGDGDEVVFDGTGNAPGETDGGQGLFLYDRTPDPMTPSCRLAAAASPPGCSLPERIAANLRRAHAMVARLQTSDVRHPRRYVRTIGRILAKSGRRTRRWQRRAKSAATRDCAASVIDQLVTARRDVLELEPRRVR